MNYLLPLLYILLAIVGVYLIYFVASAEHKSRRNHHYWIKKINQINWSRIDPKKIILVSLFTAQEFADSVKTCQSKYGEMEEFKEFTDGEINTDNLAYDDYKRVGDHWEFLDHFVKKYQIECEDIATQKVWRQYSSNSYFDPEKVILTLISREIELQDIFQKILESHDWEKLGYGFYEYYLERHIELDSGNDGHGEILDSIKDMSQLSPREKDFLTSFWELRWGIYQTITK